MLCRLVMNRVLYCGIKNQNNEIFRQDICKTMPARVVVFYMQVDVLYCGIASPYSSLYLSYFLSFHTLNNEIFTSLFFRQSLLHNHES